MIKKSSELLGIPVISIKEGKEVGRIKELIVDPEKGKIIAMIIEDEKWYQEAKIITSQVVCGVGEYAITVDSISSVVKISSMPEIVALLNKGIKEKGKKVITETGKLIGTVSEYFVEIQTGEIVAHELSPDYIIPASAVLTMGEDVLIVSKDLEKNVITNISHLKTATLKEVKKETPPAAKVEEVKKIETPKKIEVEKKVEKKIEEAKSEETPEIKKEKIEEEKSGKETKPTDLSKIFEERQKVFILGKKLRKRVEDAEGKIIAEVGDTITDEIINKAKEKGKFTELFMNITAEK